MCSVGSLYAATLITMYYVAETRNVAMVILHHTLQHEKSCVSDSVP
jgi:hypothetical protein